MSNLLVIVAAAALGQASTAGSDGNAIFSVEISPSRAEGSAWNGTFRFERDVTEGDLTRLKAFVAALGRHGPPDSDERSTFEAYGALTWEIDGNTVRAAAATTGYVLDLQGRQVEVGTGYPFLAGMTVSGEASFRQVSLTFDNRDDLPPRYHEQAWATVLGMLDETILKRDRRAATDGCIRPFTRRAGTQKDARGRLVITYAQGREPNK